MPGIDVPPDLQCSITGSIFKDPVITCDGQTYERSAISEWFSLGNNTSPLTNLVLDHIYLAVDLETTKKVKAFQAKLIDEKEFQKALFYQDVKTLDNCLYTEDQLSFEMIQPCVIKDQFKSIEWLWSKQIDKFDNKQVFRLAVEMGAVTISSWLLAKKPSFATICWSLPVQNLKMAKLFSRYDVDFSYSSLRNCSSFPAFRYVFDMLNSKTSMKLPRLILDSEISQIEYVIQTLSDLVRHLIGKGFCQHLTYIFQSISKPALISILKPPKNSGKMPIYYKSCLQSPEVFSIVLDAYKMASLDKNSLFWELLGEQICKKVTKNTFECFKIYQSKAGQFYDQLSIWRMVYGSIGQMDHTTDIHCTEILHYLIQNGLSPPLKDVQSSPDLVLRLMQDCRELQSLTDQKDKGEKRKHFIEEDPKECFCESEVQKKDKDFSEDEQKTKIKKKRRLER